MTESESSQKPTFTIQRIFVKDSSFESPNAPGVFLKDWKPEVNVDFQTKARRLEDNFHEIVLSVTATVKNEGDTAFCVEVHQAGVFAISDFPEEQHNHVIGSLCPGILYPYAREAISDMVSKGGFPQLLLSPINFDALYMQHLEEQKKAANG